MKNRSVKKATNSFSFMMQYVTGYRFIYMLSLLLMGSYSLLETVLMGRLYQVITLENLNTNIFLYQITIALVIFIGMVAAFFLGDWLHSRVIATLDKNIRTETTAHLIRMPLSVWHRRSDAYWLTTVGKDTDDAIDVYKVHVISMVRFIIQIVGGMIIIGRQSLSMAGFSMAAGLLYCGTGILQRKRMKKVSAEKRQGTAAIATSLGNVTEGNSELKYFDHLQRVVHSKFTTIIENNFRLGKRTANISILNGAMSMFGYMLAYTGSIIFGFVLVNKASLTLSSMLSLWPISVGVSYAIMKSVYLLTEYQKTASAINRLQEITGLPAETLDPVRKNVEPGAVAISLEDVSFSYDNNKSALSHITLTIPAGEKIAIVGESGSGKSTLVKLLLRFYEPDEGVIRLNLTPSQSLSLWDYRALFSYVPQTINLFTDTVYENIGIVKDSSTIESVREAAKKASADEFIENLPAGYDTLMEENGSNLSQGQRQRIGISRAFLNDSPVIVLDEITAALDNESEAKVNASLQNIKDNQTLIMITHRLSTAQLADRIIVMEDGEIKEDGSHEALLEQKGNYYELWENQ